jgi:hypothetical protein
VIVCPVPERVVVYVVKMLEIEGEAGLEDAGLEEGLERFTGMMVDVVGGPPVNVFVNIITALEDENVG